MRFPARSAHSRVWLEGGIVWALPVIVIFAIYFSPRQLLSAQTAMTGLLALGLLVLASRRPDRSLLALIILLPFQGLILSKAWALGAPASLVSHLGAWKETLALGVIVAGARSFIASGRRADTLDRVALAFIGTVALYALLGPQIAPGAPSGSNVRLLGFRELGGFVLLLLGARHAPLGPRFVERAGRVLLAVATVISAIAVFEAINPDRWNQFVVQTIRYPAYQEAVLHASANLTSVITYGSIGGGKFVRVGSVFTNELTLAWFLVLPFALALERVVRRASRLALPIMLLLGAVLLLTQTRSAIVAAAIVAFLALARAAGRPRHWRTQAALLLAGVALIAIPAAFATGFADRAAATGSQRDNSSAGHISGIYTGLDTVAAHPLGLGLGTAAGTGQRLARQKLVIPENGYLDIGVQLGLLGMAVFIALTVVLLRWLRRAALREPDPLVTATWGAGVGLAVAALFLQPWLDFSVTWSFWGIAGATIGLGFQRATVGSPRAAAPAHVLVPAARL